MLSLTRVAGRNGFGRRCVSACGCGMGKEEGEGQQQREQPTPAEGGAGGSGGGGRGGRCSGGCCGAVRPQCAAALLLGAAVALSALFLLPPFVGRGVRGIRTPRSQVSALRDLARLASIFRRDFKISFVVRTPRVVT